MTTRDHWEAVYRDRPDAQLSWLQERPTVSIDLFERLRPPPRSVIDVGGGQSSLARELVSRGVGDVAVLDFSSAAIERAKRRLGRLADRVRWIAADVLDPPDLGVFDLWHDRAVFHFLIDPADRARYAAIASRTIRPGGQAIVATFAPSGPESCSGLPVRRYSPDQIAAEFGPAFELADSATETHLTPWGKAQDFSYAVLARR